MINFNFTGKYTISCFAQNSRPGVSIKLIDSTNKLSLESYPSSTVSNVVRYSQCDNTTICSVVVLSLDVNFNDQRLLALKNITCTAENTSVPYDISVSISRTVKVIPAACINSQCVNGVCVTNPINPNAYYCRCFPGFSGKFCNFGEFSR